MNSARFNRTQAGGNDSNQFQIQNFSSLQSDSICIADTTSFSKKNMRDHRNCIKDMIEFFEIKYPTYALQVVNEIFESDLQNYMYHWFGAEKDFDCKKMHPNIIKAFMAT